MKKPGRTNKRAARHGRRRASSSESEGALMAKRETNKERAAREDFDPEERRPISIRLALEGMSVLTAKDFLDPEDPECLCLAALEERARRDIEELARQIRVRCSDKKWTSFKKRVASEQLVKLAILSTNSIYGLVKDFPEPFRNLLRCCLISHACFRRTPMICG
jgi:hypothetical protein